MKRYLLSISVLPLALVISVFLHTSITTAQEPSTQIIGNVPQNYPINTYMYGTESGSAVIKDLPFWPRATASHKGDFYLLDNYLYNKLWKIDLSNAKNNILMGSLPTRLSEPINMVSHNEILYITDKADGELWEIDPNNLKNSRSIGRLPANLSDPRAIASHNGTLYLGDWEDDELWEINIDNVERSIRIKNLPFWPDAMTSHNGTLYLSDNLGQKLWKVNLDDINKSILAGNLPISLSVSTAMTSHNGVLYLADWIDDELWRIDSENPEKGIDTNEDFFDPYNEKTGSHLTWTGGTLYQLKARLQTKGCHADQIFIYNQGQERWFLYSQYSWPLQFNQEFHDNYAHEYIPASSIYIPSCYDMCAFQYTNNVIEGIEDQNTSQSVEGWYKYRSQCIDPEDSIAQFYKSISYEFENQECNQDWDPRVIEHVFPIMPVMEDLCIIRTNEIPGTLGHYGRMNYHDDEENIWVSTHKPYVAIHIDNNNSYGEDPLFTELHEVCHSQQDWYISQFMSQHELYLKSHHTGLWYNTPAGQAFIGLANFDNVPKIEDGNIVQTWVLDHGSLYDNIYEPPGNMKIPDEVASEICAIRLYLDITGKVSFASNGIKYSSATIEHASEWLDEYIFVLE